jgi:hypothetical protein
MPMEETVVEVIYIFTLGLTSQGKPRKCMK